MIDFEIMERSLEIAWIKRIAESSNASWKIIPNQALNQYGGVEFLIREPPGVLPHHFKLLA